MSHATGNDEIHSRSRTGSRSRVEMRNANVDYEHPSAAIQSQIIDIVLNKNVSKNLNDNVNLDQSSNNNSNYIDKSNDLVDNIQGINNNNLADNLANNCNNSCNNAGNDLVNNNLADNLPINLPSESNNNEVNIEVQQTDPPPDRSPSQNDNAAPVNSRKKRQIHKGVPGSNSSNSNLKNNNVKDNDSHIPNQISKNVIPPQSSPAISNSMDARINALSGFDSSKPSDNASRKRTNERILSSGGMRIVNVGDKIELLGCIVWEQLYKVLEIDVAKQELRVEKVSPSKDKSTVAAQYCGFSNSFILIFYENTSRYWPATMDGKLAMRSFGTVNKPRNATKYNLTQHTKDEWSDAHVYGEKGKCIAFRISQETSGDRRRFWELQVEFDGEKGRFWIPTQFLKHSGEHTLTSKPDQWINTQNMSNNDGASPDFDDLMWVNVFRDNTISLHSNDKL